MQWHHLRKALKRSLRSIVLWLAPRYGSAYVRATEGHLGALHVPSPLPVTEK